MSADDAPVAEGSGESDDGSSFGVSYIGGTYSDATFPCDGLLAVQANKQLLLSGDPCSSRYNTDPFDANEESFKPGFPVRSTRKRGKPYNSTHENRVLLG